jgi:hypothetical protein
MAALADCRVAISVFFSSTVDRKCSISAPSDE